MEESEREDEAVFIMEESEHENEAAHMEESEHEDETVSEEKDDNLINSGVKMAMKSLLT